MGSPALTFYCPPRVQQQKVLLTDHNIPDQMRILVGCILYLCDSKVTGDLNSFEGLAILVETCGQSGYNISTSSISQKLKFLCEIKAATSGKEPSKNSHRFVKQFSLIDLHPIQAFYQQRAEKTQKTDSWRSNKIIKQQAEELLERQSGMFLDMTGAYLPRIESHFSIYDAAMKGSGRDPRKEIKVVYTFGKGDEIYITAVTATGGDDDIAHLSDQRAMRVLNGFLVDKLEAAKNAEETSKLLEDGYVYFDIYELCRRMGMEPGSKNRDIARAMLHRLTSTEFRIDATRSNYYKKRFGGEVSRFRYITEFEAYTAEDSVDGAVGISRLAERYYRVRIHGEIVKTLSTAGRSFISHPDLAMESNGLAHRLNNWSKAVVGVRPDKDKQRVFTLDNFHEKIHPASRIDNFKRNIISLIIRNSIGETTQGEGHCIVGLLYGYFYTLSWDGKLYNELLRSEKGRMPNGDKIVIKIERDPTDKYVGDNSAHNQALRRQLNEL